MDMKKAQVRVRQLAESQGYNIKTLSEKSGLAYPIVYKYWHGQVARVDLGSLTALAIALQCKETDLIENSSP